jgi:hypothetical protein
MKRVARDKDEVIVIIPRVVWLTVVVVEPPFAIVVIHVEQIEVAIAICNVCRAIYTTTY